MNSAGTILTTILTTILMTILTNTQGHGPEGSCARAGADTAGDEAAADTCGAGEAVHTHKNWCRSEHVHVRLQVKAAEEMTCKAARARGTEAVATDLSRFEQALLYAVASAQ
jgi:hypothetical protein